MKSIRKKLENSKTKLDTKLEEREFIFDNRSEKWQDSEKGEMYQEKTDQLQEVIDNLDFALESLETFLE